MGDGGWVHNGGENMAAGRRHGDRCRKQRAHMSTVSTELREQTTCRQAFYSQSPLPVTCFSKGMRPNPPNTVPLTGDQILYYMSQQRAFSFKPPHLPHCFLEKCRRLGNFELEKWSNALIELNWLF